uniref:Receptor ligand binding region domain-containing protein n=1 Tax=Anolis carolinensis TaxID=28377 RepID=H9GD40_ANOCA
SDKTQFPSFFRMVPDEIFEYPGIVQLLQYFGWNWVDLIVPEGASGERFQRMLSAHFVQKDICISFTHTVPAIISFTADTQITRKIIRLVSLLFSKKVKVILVYGNVQSLESLRMILEIYEHFMQKPLEKVWITTARWDVTNIFSGRVLTGKSLNGSLSLALHTTVVPGFEDFLESLNPFQSNIFFLKEFWCSAFFCSLPAYNMNGPGGNCTGEEKLGDLPGVAFEKKMTGQSYNIYNAVYAVAHALHAAYSMRTKHYSLETENRWNRLNIQPWQVNRYSLIKMFNVFHIEPIRK